MGITEEKPRRRTRPESGVEANAVLVVDDHQAVRLGVEALLADEEGIGAVRSAASAGEALAVAEAEPSDVAVVDYHLPDRDGLALTRELKAIDDPPRVLVYSAYADQRLELAALVAGADGVLGKQALGIELCERIHSLARGSGGEFSISAATLAAASYELEIDDRPILGMLINGTPPEEIARVLAISEQWLDARRWAMLRSLKEPPRVRRSEAADVRRVTEARRRLK
jgi:DNA-binding NarL/FixJ family response regulator